MVYRKCKEAQAKVANQKSEQSQSTTNQHLENLNRPQGSKQTKATSENATQPSNKDSTQANSDQLPSMQTNGEPTFINDNSLVNYTFVGYYWQQMLWPYGKTLPSDNTIRCLLLLHIFGNVNVCWVILRGVFTYFEHGNVQMLKLMRTIPS